MNQEKDIITKDFGAINAIKGYRKQFLYTLYRILNDRDNNLVFQPEGLFEDLDIKNNKGEYIETIQIKSTQGTLNFSDLFSSKDSFFKRAKTAANNENITIKLVCFGKLSEELKDRSFARIKKKLQRKGFSDSQIDKICSKYSYEEVSEVELREEILSIIKSIELFSNPEVTIDLLLFWLYQIAEKQLSVTTRDFVKQLNLIGKYLNARVDFNASFGNVIQPLELKEFSHENIELYKEGFYYGVSAKFEHILAGVDIERTDKLLEVQTAFSKSNIVFIHGASGQGKSTLAYRFIKNNLSQFSAFELKLSSSSTDVLRAVNSLEELCKGLKFPVLLYIDVLPQYTFWGELVKELYDKANISLLITIRQEDWNSLAVEHHYNFADVELNFNKNEAQLLYSHLSKHKPDLKFVDFEESWRHIGEHSPLLEYVYLITQGETLKSRLKQQIRRIQEKVESKSTKDIEILRFVCLADSLNARVNYKNIVAKLDISNATYYIDFFQKEYLIQLSDNKQFLIGLHSVRSKIISEILFDDDIYSDKFSYIDRLLGFIHENDLHTFLLNAFDINYNINQCIFSLSKISFNTWTGYLYTLKALIWKGIYDYIFQKNTEYFDALYDSFKVGWFIFLKTDFSGLRKEESIINLIKTFPNDEVTKTSILEKFNSINNQFSPKEDIYKYCKDWVQDGTEFSGQSKGNKDWENLGELVFWCGELNLNPKINITFDDIFKYFEASQSVYPISSLLLGLKHFNYLSETEIIQLEELFVQTTRETYNIAEFELSKENVNTKYFFSLLEDESEKIEEKLSKNSFNERSMEIQNLLRKAFSGRKHFEIRGYGYNVFNIDIPDATFKSMPIENLPLSYLTQLNALIINLYNYKLRVNTWKDYVEKLIEERKAYLEALLLLKKGIILYFKNNKVGIDFFINHEKIIKDKISGNENPFPKCAVDKWGYQAETIKKETKEINLSTESNEQLNYVLTKLERLKSSQDDYFRTSSNFINQSFTAITNTIQKLLNPEFEPENDNINNVSEINLFDSLVHLLTYHEEFKTHFSKFGKQHELNSLEKSETNTLFELISLWKAFLYSPYRSNKNASRMANLNFELTKTQLLMRINKAFLKQKKESGSILKITTEREDKSLVLQVYASSGTYLSSLGDCLEFVIDVFSDMWHSSIKSLITKLNFEKVVIVPLFSGNPLNNKHVEIPIFRIDSIKEKLNSGDPIDNIFEIFDFPTDIRNELLESERLIPWDEQIMEIKYYEQLMGLVHSVKLIVGQIMELNQEFKNLDKQGQVILSRYQEKANHTFVKLLSENETGIEAILKFTQLYDELSELKEPIANSFVLIKELVQTSDYHKFPMIDLTRHIEILENYYMHFSELLIDEFLEEE